MWVARVYADAWIPLAHVRSSFIVLLPSYAVSRVPQSNTELADNVHFLEQVCSGKSPVSVFRGQNYILGQLIHQVLAWVLWEFIQPIAFGVLIH